MKRSIGGIVVALALLAPASATAQVDDPDPTRYADAIEAFDDWDAKNTAPEGATLFVGSSSIRFWDTAEWFPDRTVVNRGFGGAHISDVNHYVERTVLRYAPDVVVFYAGDNDIAAGKPPEQVLDDYRAFVSTVLERDPDTEIVFIAIKPSLARWELWPEMEEANRRIRELGADRPNLHFADVAPPMLGEDGEPLPELFVDDGLHMTSAGYDVWTDVISGALERIGR